ncbi:MAG: enoyl-CoA hydratase/isomerase family protein [Acidimicrobiales bacterium]
MASRDYETITCTVSDYVAWVTLNRPDVHNAFNVAMQKELRDCWRSLRFDDDVRVAVLTGAGEKAFCTGIDRAETLGSAEQIAKAPDGETKTVGSGSTPFHVDDVGDYIGPKANDLWKPVIAAVNGMACGGAFYMLGEVEFIIAADHATFFDPHVTYGMTAAFEPIHMLQKMLFHEIMRVAARQPRAPDGEQRFHEIGLVSCGSPLAELQRRRCLVRRGDRIGAAAGGSRAPSGRSGRHSSTPARRRSAWAGAGRVGHQRRVAAPGPGVLRQREAGSNGGRAEASDESLAGRPGPGPRSLSRRRSRGARAAPGCRASCRARTRPSARS